ncbi:unnamed protein product [marine sediment metagenome]|uniref:ABC-2 type transporter domain-containing protein n=1 Tax=marine sediment metagenome TaxID=412755 RepID=X1GLX6_9ZZZZ
MPIHEQGYRHYDGRRRGRIWRSVTIARSGIRLALKKRKLVAFVLLAVTPAIVLGVLIYLASRMTEFIELANRFMPHVPWKELVGENVTVAAVWKVIFSRFLMWQLIPVGVIVTFVGPELISQDLRVRALQLYFSRPLTRIDYVLGKLVVVAVFVAMITLAPALLLYLVGVVLSRSITVVGETYPTLIAVFAGYLLITLVGGVLVLACSSMSRRSPYVAAVWGMLVILSDVAYGLVGDAMAARWAHLLSIRANVVQVLARLFGVKPAYDFVWWPSLIILGALVAAALVVIFRRLRSLEGEH